MLGNCSEANRVSEPGQSPGVERSKMDQYYRAFNRGSFRIGQNIQFITEYFLSVLSQPPILKQKQPDEPTQQKLSRQETWLLRVAGLVGMVLGSQLVLLAERYEHRLGGFTSGSFDALKRSYAAYCKEEEAHYRQPVKGLLDPFICNSWLLSSCEKAPLSKAQEVKNKLTELFHTAGRDRPFEAAARAEQANVWYKRMQMGELLKNSEYAKPIYVLLGGDLNLLRETVRNYEPGFFIWTSTIIYSVAGGAFAVGAAYMALCMGRWLHSALLLQPPKQQNIT